MLEVKILEYVGENCINREISQSKVRGINTKNIVNIL